MKRISIMLLGAILTFTNSCKKDEGIGFVPNGTSKMKINGNDWTGDVNCRFTDTAFGIMVTKFEKFDGVWIEDESFSIDNIKKIQSPQLLHTDDPNLHPKPYTYTYFFTMQGGDALCDTYTIVSEDSLNNWVEITKEKNNYAEVWGRFNITLHRIDGCKISTLPDTLRITDGTFYVHL